MTEELITAKEVIGFFFMPVLAPIITATFATQILSAKSQSSKTKLAKTIFPLSIFITTMWILLSFNPVIFKFKSLFLVWALDFTHTTLGIMLYSVGIPLFALSIFVYQIRRKKLDFKLAVLQFAFFPLALWVIFGDLLIWKNPDALSRSSYLVFISAACAFFLGLNINKNGDFIRNGRLFVSIFLLFSAFVEFLAFLTDFSNKEVAGDLMKWIKFRHADLVSSDNATAEVIMLLMMLALMIVMNKEECDLDSRWVARTKIFSSIALCLFYLEICLTWSRTQITAATLLLIFTFLLCGRKEFFTNFKAVLKKQKILSVFLIILLLAMFIAIIPILQSRLTTHEYDSIRPHLVYLALEAISNNPILGVGVNQFLPKIESSDPFLGLSYPVPVHNSILVIFSDLGIVGLLLFAIPLFFIFQKAFSKNRNTYQNVLLAALIPILLTMSFDFGYTNEFKFSLFLFIIGIFAGGICSFSDEENRIKLFLKVKASFSFLQLRKTVLLFSIVLLAFLLHAQIFQNSQGALKNVYGYFQYAQARLDSDYIVDLHDPTPDDILIANKVDEDVKIQKTSRHHYNPQFADIDPISGETVQYGELNGEWTFDWESGHRLMYRNSPIEWTPQTDIYFSGNGSQIYGLRLSTDYNLYINMGYLERNLIWYEPLYGNVRFCLSKTQNTSVQNIAVNLDSDTIYLLDAEDQKIFTISISELQDANYHKLVENKIVSSKTNKLEYISKTAKAYKINSDTRITDIRVKNGLLEGLGENENVYELN